MKFKILKHFYPIIIAHFQFFFGEKKTFNIKRYFVCQLVLLHVNFCQIHEAFSSSQCRFWMTADKKILWIPKKNCNQNRLVLWVAITDSELLIASANISVRPFNLFVYLYRPNERKKSQMQQNNNKISLQNDMETSTVTKSISCTFLSDSRMLEEIHSATAFQSI